ncbi:MAG: glycosyltransferase [Isosphaeraceae bacterium]
MVCRGKRIAFLTPEFVTECVDGGGLGNYLDRMTQALIREGHEPEVFVRSDEGPRQLLHKGVLVHRVRPANHVLAVRTAYKLIGMTGVRDPIPLVDLLSQAIGLARALRLRDDERPFDAIQSAEWQACGLMVPRRPWRRHLVRCSGLRRLYHQADGFGPERHRWRIPAGDGRSLGRADAVYFLEPTRRGLPPADARPSRTSCVHPH